MQTNASHHKARAEDDLFSIEYDYMVYETLPPRIRYVIRELSQKMSCESTKKMLGLRGTEFTLFALGKIEGIEISRFATQYKRETGCEYAFLAAGVSIQRYSNGHVPRRPHRRQMWFDPDLMTVPDWPRRRKH